MPLDGVTPRRGGPTNREARERAWLRRQMGYLKGEVGRDIDSIKKRIQELEDLLRLPRK